MVSKRIWSQRVYPDVLELTHPDGRFGLHRFSYRIYDEVSQLNWCQLPSGYASARLPNGGGNTRLHSLAVGIPPGTSGLLQIDHIDGDRKNNRDWNLRIGSIRDNHHNRQNQSVYGPCIHPAINGGYQVLVSYGQERSIFSPVFKNIDPAYLCRDIYLQIAAQYDAGNINKPTKQELREIANSIRS